MTLRRLDRPGGVPQRLLMRELNLTPETMTVRVERLCARGLACRSPDAGDRRNSLVALTTAGRRLLVSFEGSTTEGATPRLGITVAPAPSRGWHHSPDPRA